MNTVPGYLSYTGLCVDRDLLIAAVGATAYSQLLKKLTLTYLPRVGPPLIVKQYSLVLISGRTMLQLPRCLTPKFKTLVIYPPPQLVKFPQIDTLFENQKCLIDYLMTKVYTPQRIAAGTATSVINLRAGLGKTFVAAGMISAIGMRTLYIVAKCPLAEQAQKDLQGVLSVDLPDEDQSNIDHPQKITVKIYTGSKRKITDVTICVINTALKQNGDFFSQFGLVIMDEVQDFCSEDRRKIFKSASAPCVLVMSATTEDRTDGMHIIFHREFSMTGDGTRDLLLKYKECATDYNLLVPVRVTENANTTALRIDNIIRADQIPGFAYDGVIFTGKVTSIQYTGPKSFTRAEAHPSTGRLFTPWLNDQFVNDPYRMRIVLEHLRELYNKKILTKNEDGVEETKHHCIYVFCENVQPLHRLSKLFSTIGPVFVPELLVKDDNKDAETPKTIRMFTGGCKPDDIKSITTTARIILTTYGYSSTGISIPRMTAMIFMTPRKSGLIQILARILRRDGDQTIPRDIIDIVDVCTPIKGQANQRQLAYDFYGFEVIKKKELWSRQEPLWDGSQYVHPIDREL